MQSKRVKKSVAKGLRRCLWELLTPDSQSFSEVLRKFAHMDTGTFSQAAKEYHAQLVAMGKTCSGYAWHQTIERNPIYRATVKPTLNRAEKFLALALFEFGHQVALNQLGKPHVLLTA